jgi:hypothetical protein
MYFVWIEYNALFADFDDDIPGFNELEIGRSAVHSQVPL